MKRKYTDEFKKLLCQEFLDSTMKLTEFCQLKSISVKTFEKWISLYRYNDMCFDTSIKEAKFRKILPKEKIFDIKPDYSTMSIKELKEAILERDIEIARLKKNFVVNITSEGKEYVSLYKKNMK